MQGLLKHVRSNVVGYLALFVALSGTTYAAVSLPAGSVGARQIQNHVIDPVKFDSKTINGNVRAWVEVNAAGKVLAGGGKPTVVVRHGGGVTGQYLVSFHTAFFRACLPVAGIAGSATSVGFAQAALNGTSRGLPDVAAFTYDQQGQPDPLPFYAAVLC